MKLKIKEIAYHRNGVSGAGFHAVLFQDKENKADMVGIVFDEPGCVAILDTNLLAAGNIKFGENSWRGDHYEKDLREAVA